MLDNILETNENVSIFQNKLTKEIYPICLSNENNKYLLNMTEVVTMKIFFIIYFTQNYYYEIFVLEQCRMNNNHTYIYKTI